MLTRLGEDIPRRICMDHWIPAERAINDVKQIVEGLGCHVALTDAVILLGQAQDKIADWAEETGNILPESIFVNEGGTT
jgi:hypothetical protein